MSCEFLPQKFVKYIVIRLLFQSDQPEGNLTRVEDAWWASEWTFSKYQAQVITKLIEDAKHVTQKVIDYEATELLKKAANKDRH